VTQAESDVDGALRRVESSLDRPHSARMYDYYLGGHDNYRADRQAAGQVIGAWPSALTAARVNRAFMRRSTLVAARRGIRQFLDIGTGIPTRPNLHEVAQSVRSDARVVYTDNDPVVLAHARALLASTPEGRTEYVDADATDPHRILDAPEFSAALDLSEPVALSLNAVLHFIPDDRDPHGMIRTLMDAFVPGSYLILSQVTPDMDPETIGRVQEIYRQGGIAAQIRTRAEVEVFFEGMELLEPGIVPPHQWRPGEEGDILVTGDVGDGEASQWAGMAVKTS
jgi:hypothetical protein